MADPGDMSSEGLLVEGAQAPPWEPSAEGDSPRAEGASPPWDEEEPSSDVNVPLASGSGAQLDMIDDEVIDVLDGCDPADAFAQSLRALQHAHLCAQQDGAQSSASDDSLGFSSASSAATVRELLLLGDELRAARAQGDAESQQAGWVSTELGQHEVSGYPRCSRGVIIY